MAFSLTRLTLYAIISSIEFDLREFIVFSLGHVPVEDILGKKLYEKVLLRLKNDVGLGDISLELLLFYADFGDLIQIINRNTALISQDYAKYFKELTSDFEVIIPVRNRVSHSRPLAYEDLPITFDLANKLIYDNQIAWPELKNTLANIKKDQSFVLGLNIPKYNDDVIFNNLPLPDFDETGFLGRQKEVKKLYREIVADPYPVISVLGDGGVGKTALVLNTVYRILDSDEHNFDGVIWTSSKTTRVTLNYIEEIQNAITTSAGLMDDILESLSGKKSTDPMAEITNYMKEFNILLIMDNLETVLDNNLTRFFENLPQGSKVIITSRIGLGAFEYPYKLQGLSKQEARTFFRAVAKVRGADSLLSLSDNKIQDYCNRMEYNPGFIKWFISTVQVGARPEAVLDHSEQFLDFCMSNVYEFLSDKSKYVLKTLMVISGQLSMAELAYYTQYDSLELQTCIFDLVRTNMVQRISTEVGTSIETRFDLSDLARKYLIKHHSVDSDSYKKFQRLKRKYTADVEKFYAKQPRNIYRSNRIRTRTKRDWLVAKKLKDVLHLVNQEKFDDSIELLEEAKSLDPSFFEVHRVEAYVMTVMNNMSAAQAAYELALELESEYPPLYKFYGQFLLTQLEDTEGALAAFEAGYSLDKNSGYLKLGIARCQLYLSNYTESLKLLKEIFEVEQEYSLIKVAYDLYLQSYYRTADDYADSGNFVESIESLQTLIKEYNRCPPLYKDTYNYKTLRKIPTVISKFKRHMNNHPKKYVLHDIEEWLNDVQNPKTNRISYYDIGRKFKGIVYNLISDKNYGFIQYSGNEKERIFFHRTNMAWEIDWENIKIGDRVVFIVAKNEENDKLHAVEVEIDDYM